MLTTTFDMVVTGEMIQDDEFLCPSLDEEADPSLFTDLARGARLGKHVDDGVVAGTPITYMFTATEKQSSDLHRPQADLLKHNSSGWESP